MSYIPNNPLLYNAALTGFVNGVYQLIFLGNSSSISFDDVLDDAELFAETVDSLIPPTSSSLSTAEAIYGICQSTNSQRYDRGTHGYSEAAIAVVNKYADLIAAMVPNGTSGTLRGPGVTAAFTFDIPPGVTIATVKCLGRVVSTSAIPGPGVEIVGSSYATVADFGWKKVGPTVSVLPTISSEPTVLSDSDAIIGTEFDGNTTGTQATVTCTTSLILDPTTVMAYQIELRETDTL